MATKDSNISKMKNNKESIKKVSAKVHEELLNTSHLFIDETVATLTRMQKITGKVIKKSEPILEKQIDIAFDTVEALADQASKGGKRALKLFGLTKQYNKLSNTITEKVNEIPSVEEMIDDAKEIVANAKSDVEEKFDEIKENLKVDELEEAAKARFKSVKETAQKATEKVIGKAKVAKKDVAKTTKKVTKTTAKNVTKKVEKVAKKTPAPKTTTTASELTKIKGIGPSLASIMNENGIKTINDLKKATPSALKVIANKAGNRYKSFDTKNWVEAAKAVAK